MNVGALFASVLAANAASHSEPEPYVEMPWWSKKSTMARWPRFLLWLIRRRTQRRSDGKTWVRLDDWLWDKYFAAIDKEPNQNTATEETTRAA